MLLVDRGLTSPHKCRITLFSQYKQISQSGQDLLFYFMFSLTFTAFVMLVTFLLFQSNLYVVLAHGGPKNSVPRDLFKIKNPQTPSAIITPYGAWMGLQPT